MSGLVVFGAVIATLADGPGQLGVGLLFMVVGGWIPVWLLIGHRRHRSLLGGGQRTVGEVVGKRIKSRGDSTKYLISVAFEDHNGVKVLKEFNVVPRAQQALKEGDDLPIMFDSRKPKRALLGPPDLLPDVFQRDYGKWYRVFLVFLALFFFVSFVAGVVLVVAALTGHIFMD